MHLLRLSTSSLTRFFLVCGYTTPHHTTACCLAGEWERGAGLLQRMDAAGHAAGEETYLGVLQALGKV